MMPYMTKSSSLPAQTSTAVLPERTEIGFYRKTVGDDDMKETMEQRAAYREYVQSDEAVEQLLKAEEVELEMPAPEDRETRVTVRLKGDDIKLVDTMCEILGVGRSTFMKMAARMVAQGVSVTRPFEESRQLPLTSEEHRLERPA